MRNSSKHKGDGTIEAALKSAKNGDIEKALQLVKEFNEDSQSTEALRNLALIYSYCDQEPESERLWRVVCAQSDVGLGDFFMLGSIQSSLGHNEEAIGSFRKEIEASAFHGNKYYLTSSAMNLACLLVNSQKFEEAKEILGLITGSEGVYVHGAGQVKKEDLIAKISNRNGRA